MAAPIRHRVIIDSDAKNEADDQFAIVHALLSPSIDVTAIIAAHFGTWRTQFSMQESRAEIDLLLGMMNLGSVVPAVDGAATPMTTPTSPVDSAGARMIIEQANRPGPLFAVFLGPLTDMASALLLDPAIAHNGDLTVVWVGGAPYDGAYVSDIDGEYNASNDVHAVNVVLQSGVRVWQIPWTVYSMVGVGFAELDARVAPCGELGAYLVAQLKEWNRANVGFEREVHSLGDSPAIGVVLNPSGALWREHPAREFDDRARLTSRVLPGRTVRVADAVDVRWLLEDMFAKIRMHSLGVAGSAQAEITG